MSNETYWDSIQIIKDPKKKEIAASFIQTDGGDVAGLLPEYGSDPKGPGTDWEPNPEHPNNGGPEPQPPETEIPPSDEFPECLTHDCDALTEAEYVEANRKVAFFINVPSVTEFNQLLNFEEDPVDYFANTSFIPWFLNGPLTTEGPCTLNNVNRPNGVNFIIREGTQANPKTGNSRIIEQNSGAGFGPTATRSNIGTTSITGSLRFWYYPYTGDPDTLTTGVASASMYNAGYRIWADGGLRPTFKDLSVYVDAQNGKIGITDGPSMTYDPTKWWLPITFSWSSTLTIVTEQNGGQYPGYPFGPVDILSNTAQGTLSYDNKVLSFATAETEIGTFVASAGFKEDDGTDDFASLVSIPTGALLLGFVRDPEDTDSISRHFRAYTTPDYCSRIP